MRRAILVAACAAMLAAAPGVADAQAQQQPSKLVVGSPDASGFPAIKAAVVVTDSVGLPVLGLKDTDFGVVEDGKTAPVTSVETLTNQSADMTAVLVLDTSGSMAGQPLSDAVAAVSSFVDQVGPDAQVGGVSLGGQCTVDPGPGLSRDKAGAKEFFAGAEAGGDTPLYDATLTAVQQSLTAPQGRRMVIVLTDGEDTCSKVSFDTLVNAAVHNGVPLTFIGLGPDIRPDVLQNLAGLTGGQFIAADDSSKLAAIYTSLTTRLRTQYAVQFKSGQFADRHEHTFVVHVRAAGAETTGESRYTTPAIPPKPQVGLTSRQQISSPATFSISNQSLVQLAQADVYLDDTLLEHLSGTVMSYTLDPSGLSGGTHTVRVHVTDSTGAAADASVAVEFVDTGLFGRVPFWAILAVVLLLPVLAIVGIVMLSGRRRGLRCAKCHRPLQAEWAACPYCSRPEPGPVVAVQPQRGPAPVPPIGITSAVSTNGHAQAAETLIGRSEAPRPIGAGAATQLLGVGEVAGAWLVISAGDQHGTRFRLGSAETVIGRDGDNGVVLDDVGASRQHAQIRHTAEGYQLTDLDTTNGTRLNGKTIHRELLRQGDVIEIGSTRLTFVTVSGPQG